MTRRVGRKFDLKQAISRSSEKGWDILEGSNKFISDEIIYSIGESYKVIIRWTFEGKQVVVKEVLYLKRDVFGFFKVIVNVSQGVPKSVKAYFDKRMNYILDM